MEQPYTNRELDMKFCEVHEKLDLILLQTTKTNGSVLSLKLWRSWMTGALAVCGLVMVLVVYIFNMNTQNIKDALGKYEQETKQLLNK